MGTPADTRIDGTDRAPIRRGVLFLVNIGTPIIAGVASGDLRPTVTAAVLGMLLSFADNNGTLPRRLRLLVMDAAVIAALGCAGYLSGKTPGLYWPLLIALTLAIGFSAAAGREPVILARHGGIAFVAAAAAPGFDTVTLIYLGGAVLLNALTRSIDHWLFGPLPLLPQVPLQKPASRGGWIRFALALAAAATFGMWVGDWLGEQHGYWIAITILVVMQPDVRASSARIIQRIAGTLAGVGAAWAIAAVIHSRAVNCAAVLIVAPFIPHHVTQRYWLHTALIALLVLLAFDLAQFNSQGLGQLPLERIVDILIGCGLALAGTAAAFPRALFSHVASGAIISGRK
jgi:hypothetical protein